MLSRWEELPNNLGYTIPWNITQQLKEWISSKLHLKGFHEVLVNYKTQVCKQWPHFDQANTYPKRIFMGHGKVETGDLLYKQRNVDTHIRLLTLFLWEKTWDGGGIWVKGGSWEEKGSKTQCGYIGRIYGKAVMCMCEWVDRSLKRGLALPFLS